MNNFQRLMTEEERSVPQPPPVVQKNVEGTLGMLRFIGKIVEVYLPQFSSVLISVVGGSESDNKNTVPTNTERRILPHDDPRNPTSKPGRSGIDDLTVR